MVKDHHTYFYTVTEPFVVVGCRTTSTIALAPLDSLEFTSFSTGSLSSVNDVSYDPVDEKIYYATQTSGIYRINLDGSNDEQVVATGKSDQECIKNKQTNK